jgi:hypothetical protein
MEKSMVKNWYGIRFTVSFLYGPALQLIVKTRYKMKIGDQRFVQVLIKPG